MTVLHWIIFVLLYLGTVISSLRWARIAQREHYIPKSISRFYWRWIRLKSPNLILLFTIIILTIGSLWYERIAFLLIPVLLIFPFGVGYKSRTEEVVYTPRLRRLIIVYIVLVTLISFLFLVNGLGYFGILLCFIFSPYIFDQSLKLMFNYEKRISNFYIESAVSGLQKVKGPIIAITGSYSKTTTKEVLKQLFELDANVFATPDSFNNRLGIAKSINESEMRGIEVAIIEMGTYGQGEIKEISSIKTTGKFDTVGAGDSMLAGICIGLASGQDAYNSACLGTLAAAVTIQKLYQTGTVSPDELLELAN